MCKNRSKYIDSVATIQNLLDYVKRSKLVEINKIIISDYRGFIIGINLEIYFEEKLNCWDQIFRSVINLERRLHRQRFIKLLEEKLDEMRIEDKLFKMTHNTPSKA